MPLPDQDLIVETAVLAPDGRTAGDDPAPNYRGQCFCGAVTIEVTGEPQEMGYCHCGSCRSYSGGAVTAYPLWKAENVRVARGVEYLGSFSKTEISRRRFCTRCGGHVMTEHPELGLSDVHRPVLPDLDFKPALHLHYAETVLPMRDGLPKLRDFPKSAGGSGELLAE